MAWVDTQFEEPEQIQFIKLEAIGDFVEGVFAGTRESTNSFGRKEVHALIKTGVSDDGEAIIESLRTNQRLLAQIASVRRGALIRIEYVDDRPNDGVDREGRPLSPTKLFRVQVDDGRPAAPPPSPGPARVGPSDDIPF